MRSLLQYAWKFAKEENGPTAVEYAVMLALIVLIAMTAIAALGTTASSTFNSTQIENAMSS
jgi:pilus assembly protein Flp/PilA